MKSFALFVSDCIEDLELDNKLTNCDIAICCHGKFQEYMSHFVQSANECVYHKCNVTIP